MLEFILARLSILLKLLAPLVAVALLVAVEALGATAKTAEVRPTPRTFFGMHIHRVLPNSLWQTGEFGAVRLHDANVTWLDIEPEAGNWKFEKLDAIVDRLRRQQVEILLPLQATPEWAAFTPQSKGAYGPGANTLPARPADWDAYVSKVVTRYRGRIAAYEVWNEPNLKQFYAGSPEAMAELTIRTARLVRAADSSAVVVCSGITGSYGIEWLTRYLKAGAGQACDVIGYHFYTRHEMPETMLVTIRNVRRAMSENGLDLKPLWNTETGWLVDQPGGIDVKQSGFEANAPILDERQASAYILRAHLLARGAGVERFYWYSWDHAAMGITGQRGVNVTFPGRVYTDMVKIIIGAKVSECSELDGVWRCRIQLASGLSASVLWSVSRIRPYHVASNRQVGIFEIPNGYSISTSSAKGVDIQLNSMPTLVFDE